MIKSSLHKILSLAVSFGMAATCLDEAGAQPVGPSAGKYRNFITTLKSLCQKNKYVLLADTDHGALEILDLTTDSNVLQAIKECGGVYVVEKGIEENQGYRNAKITPDPAQLNAAIQHIQGYLAAHGIDNLKLNGEWDEATHAGFMNYVAKNQAASGFTKTPDGIYSAAFAHHFLEFSNAGQRLKDFFAAVKFLDDAGVLPVPSTAMTQYQDVQENPGLTMPPYPQGEPHTNLVNWYQQREIFNAAKVNLPLVFPDPRFKKMGDDAEMSQLLSDVLYANADRSPAGNIYDIIHMDARLNKDVPKRQVGLRLEIVGQESLSPRVNQEIVTNTLQLAGGKSAVIKYGALHFSAPHDMNEMLGGSSVTILLKHRPDQILLCPMEKRTKLAWGSCEDSPHYVYDISRDSMDTTEKGSVTEKAYTSMLRTSITPAEYATAVAKLPPSLKAYAFPYSEYDADQNNDRVPQNWLSTTRVYQLK